MRLIIFKREIYLNQAGAGTAGFSLIEMMVVVFVSVLLLGALIVLYLLFSRSFTFQQSQVAVTEASRFAGEAVQNRVAQAYRVVASSTLDSVVYTSATTTLVLQLSAIDAQGLTVPAAWDYAAFYLEGNDLMEKYRPHAQSVRSTVTRKLSNDVYNLVFTYDNADFAQVKKVTLELENRINTSRGTLTHRILENLFLKNYY